MPRVQDNSVKVLCCGGAPGKVAEERGCGGEIIKRESYRWVRCLDCTPTTPLHIACLPRHQRESHGHKG